MPSSALMSSTVTGKRVHQDDCSCLRHGPGGLLQHDTRRCTEVFDRRTATATCTECGSTFRQRHAQVWPRTVADSICSMWQIGLGTSYSHYSPSVSTRQSAEVPGRLLHRCLRHRRSSETALSTSSPAGCAMSSTQYLGHRAFSVAEPIVWNSLPDELRDNIEDTAVLGSHWKLCFSVSTGVPNALEAYLYTTVALYKSTFYLLTD